MPNEENPVLDRYTKAQEAAEKRFFTANDGKPATEAQKLSVLTFKNFAIDFGIAIELHCPDPRNKALALTHLEDVLMRANRGVFA